MELLSMQCFEKIYFTNISTHFLLWKTGFVQNAHNIVRVNSTLFILWSHIVSIWPLTNLLTSLLFIFYYTKSSKTHSFPIHTECDMYISILLWYCSLTCLIWQSHCRFSFFVVSFILVHNNSGIHCDICTCTRYNLAFWLNFGVR